LGRKTANFTFWGAIFSLEKSLIYVLGAIFVLGAFFSLGKFVYGPFFLFKVIFKECEEAFLIKGLGAKLLKFGVINYIKVGFINIKHLGIKINLNYKYLKAF